MIEKQAVRETHLELIAPGTRAARIYALTTTDPLDRVLSSGYFDRFAEWGLRKADRIMVSANLHGAVDCCWLVCEANVEGHVSVRRI